MFIPHYAIEIIGSVNLFADMNVDKSDGVLTITSDISGTIIAKVIGPDDKVVVNDKYEGSSFTWVPSGIDGAYRYDVRVISLDKKQNNYQGGSIEIFDGQLITKHKGK